MQYNYYEKGEEGDSQRISRDASSRLNDFTQPRCIYLETASSSSSSSCF